MDLVAMAEVCAFLKGLSLGSYLTKLVEEGYDDMRSITELAESDLLDLGMKKGHAKRLIGAIRGLGASGGPAPPPPPPPPAVVKNYTVKEKLGEGSFGLVHRVEHPDVDQLLAMKIQYCEGLEAVNARVREATFMIPGGYLVPCREHIIETHEDKGRYVLYVIMPLLDGSLEGYLAAKGPLSEENVRVLMTHVGKALILLHRLGRLHGGVRPPNIMHLKDPATDTFTFLLGDMGMAADPAHVTKLGVPIYLPHSLMQLRGSDIDMYALGITACEAGSSVQAARTIANGLVRAVPLDEVRAVIREETKGNSRFIEPILDLEPWKSYQLVGALEGRDPMKEERTTASVEFGRSRRVNTVPRERDDAHEEEEVATPLHAAVFSCKPQLVLGVLLYYEGQRWLNEKDTKGRTPLLVAATHGELGVVEELVNCGADVTLGSRDGTTPLHAAAACGSRGMVQALVSHGAEVLRRNNEGRTALDVAKQNGHGEVAAFLECS